MESTLSAPPNPPQRLLRRDFGLFSRLIGFRYFEVIPFPAEGEAQLAKLAAEGDVVHVMRSAGVLNFLYLAWALIRRSLPPIRAAIGLRWTWWRPYSRLFREGTVAERLNKALDAGTSALVFLREPTGLAAFTTPADDPFPALIARARASKRPLFLVPELFLWRSRARTVQPRVRDLLFGSPESPGMLQTTLAFLLNHRHAFMRVGTQIDLTAFVRENSGDSDAVLARKVRGALYQNLARETRAIVGPPLKSAHRLIEETLRDRRLRSAVEEAEKEKNAPAGSGLRDAERYLKEIAARFNPSAIAVVTPLLRWVFNRIYEGVEVDEKGLARTLTVAREAPLVFCPSHKSHVDYLVMSWVLTERGITPPHVAAGANLSFFPLGNLFRRGGAFFLRRSFKGNKIYAATFRAYVKKLLKEGYAQEFFIEGGRSRTGKLLSPKLGMVAFEVEAFLEGAQDDVFFVPVAIDYEKIVEAREYAKELAGGEKKAESIRGLLSAPKVLASKYGRIYLSFEEPISLRKFVEQRGRPEDLTPDERRAAVRALAQRITFGISRAQTITPAALLSAALLAHRRRGVKGKDVGARIHYLRELAQREGARLSAVMENAPSDPATLGPINEVVRLFMEDGLISCQVAGGDAIYAVPDEQRPSLAFYKNNLVHLVVSRSLVATALLSLHGEAPLDELRARTRELSRLLKFEFQFRVGASFETIFDETMEALAKEALVVREGDRVRIAPEPHARPDLAFLRDLTRDFVESYRLLVSTLPSLKGPTEKKDVVRLAFERGRADFLSGTLAFAEALSRPNIENAVAWCADQKILVAADADGKKVVRSPEWSDEKVAGLVASIDRFLSGETQAG